MAVGETGLMGLGWGYGIACVLGKSWLTVDVLSGGL